MTALSQENKDLFISEAREHLDELDTGLIEFEKDKANLEVVKELMRHAHTLKGIAATASFGEISNLAHSFEGMVENVKNKLSTGGMDLLFGAIDELRRLVDDAETGNASSAPMNPLVDEVGELENEDHEKDAQVADRPDMFRKLHEVKVKTDKLDTIMGLAGELLLNKLRFSTTLPDPTPEEADVLKEHARLVDDLQYQVLQLRLTPIEHVFNRFPRMVRDLSKKEQKTVNLEIKGGDIELDRSVLDELGEPIVHLLRNAIDHGIEKEGTVTLSASRMKDQVIIGVTDTGAGINWEKVRAKKEQAGSKLSDEDFILSGVSTNDHVTEISGRGVGLNVVKTKIEELSGSVEITSSPGKGTTFMLYLPVSVAIIKALLITINKHTYAIPANQIARLMQVTADMRKKQADNEFIIVDEKEVPLISLSKKLHTSDTKGVEREQALTEIALLATTNDEMVGFMIDEVREQQDIIVKPIPRSLKQHIAFSAVTILGDGTPVPILDLESIV